MILEDDCSEESGGDRDWIVPNANDTDAEIIINMGCTKKLKGIQMKNIKRKIGGTKGFIISVSEFSEGPWVTILEGAFKRQETFGCAKMKYFDFE